MWHSVDPFVTVLFGLGCFLAGLVVAIGTVKWLGSRGTTKPDRIIDSAFDSYLAEQAARFADERGTPALTGLIHHRLRTAVHLADRTQRRFEP